MKSTDIRRLFIDYFKQHTHTAVSSGSLIPVGDSTLLFTNAGMVQFKDVFLGREKRSYTRAVTAQGCIRAGGKHNDLENVGYTARHHTFFEMLGNFSFGDYFKREAINFAWNFLTKELKLPAEKLWVTVYEDDQEAADIWLKELNVSSERFSRCGEKDNFWSMGDTGPCGPCSEIFYDHGPEIAGGPPGSPNEDGDRYVEIWNLVFMQFNRTADGQMHPLPKPSVDTGMGLERLCAVMQGVHSNYDIDIFQHLIHSIHSLNPNADKKNASFKVIADHIRSCAFLISESVYPSNEGRGYVLRRIIRRALRHGNKLGIEGPFFFKLVTPLIETMGDAYPVLKEKQTLIEKALKQEEEQFSKTLANGLALLESNLERVKDPIIPGDIVFKLYDTYGFPVDLTADIAREKSLEIDIAGFEAAMQKQRENSQKANAFKANYGESIDLEESSEFHGYEYLALAGQIQKIIEPSGKTKTIGIVLDKTPFYAESGGQVGDTGSFFVNDQPVFFVQDTQKAGDAIVHYGQWAANVTPLSIGTEVLAKVDDAKRRATRVHHSVTHLLHSALQEIVGEHVEQKGSLVTPEKTRFDFSHTEPLTREQIEATEQWVNEKILLNVPVHTAILPFEEARESGAMALFGEKYGDTVRVLSMGDFSKELCGGTHTERTGDIGSFKIISESGVAAGVRRIEGVAGLSALHWLQHQTRLIQDACTLLHCNTEQLSQKIGQTLQAQAQSNKMIEQLDHQLINNKAEILAKEAKTIGNINVLVTELNDVESKHLRTLVDSLKNKLHHAVIVLVCAQGDKIQAIAALTKECLNKIPGAKTWVQMIVEKGGGRDDMAQGGSAKPVDLQQRLENVRQKLEKCLIEAS
jgi:alanyl-tRNA synthetase